MNQTAAPLVDNNATPAAGTPLASVRHTLIFLLICVALTVFSAMNAADSSAAGPVHSQGEMLKFYIFLIGMQWLWVRFVAKGMQDKGRSVFEFFGARKRVAWQLVSDVALGALALVVIYALQTGIDGLTQRNLDAANPMLPATPTGVFAVSVWMAVSVTAGICEEIVFRGYLQRQLAALTGNLPLAIVLQALIFAIGHAYEGMATVLDIVMHGLMLGLLAAWRKNIRAGIVEHAAWDIIAGLGWMRL